MASTQKWWPVATTTAVITAGYAAQATRSSGRRTARAAHSAATAAKATCPLGMAASVFTSPSAPGRRESPSTSPVPASALGEAVGHAALPAATRASVTEKRPRAHAKHAGRSRKSQARTPARTETCSPT